ncbi:zinc finger BED domain-containing protein RICESLEEPER 2-like [Benincasa hispida]|uniref:zinc finger BED domain-containing protein RICESLEEPER 2-like n=1 Tax=Benincasa hispida TaxID=102211 RepID=UPI00190204D4|nr:zinc finger BED domain-containing protein RICESLEEPER 2-like [Benincasa hispida]
MTRPRPDRLGIWFFIVWASKVLLRRHSTFYRRSSKYRGKIIEQRYHLSITMSLSKSNDSNDDVVVMPSLPLPPRKNESGETVSKHISGRKRKNSSMIWDHFTKYSEYSDDDPHAKYWKLHKRILTFTQIENHKGETIGKEVEKCLKQWGIEKVMTLTVDNASSNDTAIAYLKKRFKHGLVLDDAVRFVRSSPTRLVTFKKCITEESIDSKSMLCHDFSTRWNSTYLMLEAAVKFEKAFERLEDYDTVYMNEEEKPTTRDWEIARIFIKFFSVFYEVTVRLSGSLYVTSNTIFHEISIVQNCIRKYSSATGPKDVLLQEMATKMQEKFDKYWGNRDRKNLFLYVAFVLDPRYKMKFLLNCLNQLFYVDVAKAIGSKVEGVLRVLFNEYNLSLSVANKGQSSCTIKSFPFRTSSASASEIFRFDFEDLDEDDSQSVDQKLNIYLLEPRVKREDDFVS